jgi:hypothetical protein
MHSNSDLRQGTLPPSRTTDDAIEGGSRIGPRRGRPRSGTQTRIASFRLSAEDFRVLSTHRRIVQEALEKKLAELRQSEEEAIRSKCAQEALDEPYDWEESWSAAGAADVSRAPIDE